MLSRLSTSVRLMISPPSARNPRLTRYSCQATWTKRTLSIFFCKDTSIPPFRKIMLSIVINKKTLKTVHFHNLLITTYQRPIISLPTPTMVGVGRVLVRSS